MWESNLYMVKAKIIVATHKKKILLLHTYNDSIKCICSPSIQEVKSPLFWNEEINIKVFHVIRKQ